ncbi:uncharacterized protein LOC131423309 isoform X3 [Marmota monax]|uniref:uncharacterized protein LOC131423309 isoform X3 n=1 Tax=Marmota monax TaxID=9995 RepID=UPI0026F33755|nr:uncharacterized protein LOC131423309 isoform X3 [Marmota monax]
MEPYLCSLMVQAQKGLFVLSGCLNVQSDMEEIEPRFKRLKIDPEKPPLKRKRYRKKTKRNQIDPAEKLISWEDVKKLTTQASRIIRLLGKNKTPVMMDGESSEQKCFLTVSRE